MKKNLKNNWRISQATEEMIKIEFQSESDPNWWHMVTVDVKNKIAWCDCMGYLKWKHCWHIQLVLRILKKLGIRNKWETRVCQWCRNDFIPHKTNQQFCSTKCQRAYAYYRRKKEKSVANFAKSLSDKEISV